MPRMFPERLHVETRSHAERTLYNAFQSQLANEYVVFHSVAWLARDTRSGARDGEADFVIAHPTKGLVILEVKGGAIRYDGAAGQWYSGSHLIKDPFEQAKGNKYSLLQKLKDLPYWRARRINIGHAVAFPDVAVKGALRLDAPREIVMDLTDLHSLATWLDNLFIYWDAQSGSLSELERAGIEELIRLLSPSWQLRSPLAAAFQAEEREIIRLTEQQFHLLDFLAGHRRVAIAGCAGSGKTMLAAEQAARLARQGFRVLLTCFNRNLALFLRSQAQLPPTVTVSHFHELCSHLAQQAGLLSKERQSQPAQSWFDQTLPDLLLNSIEIIGPQYDAIIVDEAQDFRPMWWLPLLYTLNDPDQGILYTFYDDNQVLYGGATAQLPDRLERFSLNRNCRNTQEIHQTFLPFYRSSLQPIALGPAGRKPKIYRYNSPADLQKQLRGELHQLIHQEELYTEDIVILTPRARDKSLLWQTPQLGNCRLTETWPPGDNEVFVTTVHSFKGLESPVVLLVELDPEHTPDLETIIYVGCSRARHHLVIFAPVNLPESIHARFLGGSSQM